jgi:hypothetical protein
MGKVRALEYDDGFCDLEAAVPTAVRQRLARYLVEEPSTPVEKPVSKS